LADGYSKTQRVEKANQAVYWLPGHFKEKRAVKPIRKGLVGDEG